MYQDTTLTKEEMIQAKPKFHIIAVDHTQHWDPAIVKKFGRIATMYIANFNEYVYLCSMTPAVWAEFVYNVPERLLADIWDDYKVCDEWSDLSWENGNECGSYYNVGSSFLFDDGGKELEITDEEWLEYLEICNWNTQEAKDGALEGFMEYINGNEPEAIMHIIDAMEKAVRV